MKKIDLVKLYFIDWDRNYLKALVWLPVGIAIVAVVGLFHTPGNEPPEFIQGKIVSFSTDAGSYTQLASLYARINLESGEVVDIQLPEYKHYSIGDKVTIKKTVSVINYPKYSYHENKKTHNHASHNRQQAGGR